MTEQKLHTAIIGAGPAGLYAAQKLVSLGYGTAIFNRDIKPGGLVEYGIFLEKFKIKNGFRAQFQQILSSDQAVYFGNVTVGKNGRLHVEDLFSMGFSAVLLANGAQGTKYINLPGETLEGVLHAKDLVYHYNQLPPFSTRHYPIGKKVAIVGAGNVMADITHYLIGYRDVEEITVIVRRGPAEVKFDQKELLPIIGYFDLDDFEKEIERVTPAMKAIGQDVETSKHKILVALEKACPVEHKTRILLRFLTSPKEIMGSQGVVSALKVEQNTLELSDGIVVSRGLGQFSQLDVDTVIFAIGDKVDSDLGLPMENGGICKARNPKYPIEGNVFEVGDPATGEALPGVFHAGWSRNPSTGLAGVARRDGVFAASAIAEYLTTLKNPSSTTTSAVTEQLVDRQINYVTKENLKLLSAEEQHRAQITGSEEFKFLTNAEMLHAMGLPAEE